MKNKVKKFAALALALAMIFALAACGEPTEPSEETGQPTGETEPSLKPEDIKLAYACWNLTNEWFISSWRALKTPVKSWAARPS